MSYPDFPTSDGLRAARLGTLDTRQRAEAHVTAALGGYSGEHDVSAIADDCYDLVGTWDVRQVEPEDFWAIVRARVLDR